MLVQAVFFSICAAGVAFLLRFLFALESDLRVHRGHSARVERIHNHLVLTHSVASGSAPGPILVHFNPGLAQRARRGVAAVGARANENPGVKEA